LFLGLFGIALISENLRDIDGNNELRLDEKIRQKHGCGRGQKLLSQAETLARAGVYRKYF
jgi:hypothetical protein